LRRLNLRARKGLFDGPEPLLVQAFFKGESADAIPADQFVLYPGKEVAPLMLPEGTFRVRAVGARGEVAGEYEARVKKPRGEEAGRAARRRLPGVLRAAQPSRRVRKVIE
jgi:hypothetical protein